MSEGIKKSFVTGYQYEENICSDRQFLQDSISKMEKPEEAIILATDGGYGNIHTTIKFRA
ncbi:hypothetical protein LQZ18_00890 [Lachnospiraceae bacterium ZAX-1]